MNESAVFIAWQHMGVCTKFISVYQ